MIEYLSGKVLARLPNTLVVDVNGVGYGIEMPLSSLCETPTNGSPIQLWIDTYVREDAIRLFGFLTYEDRQAFLMLRSVSGIGPKIALAVMSTLDARNLRLIVLQGKVARLEAVPGIGKRTAERLLLELKPKMEKFSFASPGIQNIKAPAKEDESEQSERSLDPKYHRDGTYDDVSDDQMQKLQGVVDDIRSALENLGYKDKDISPIVNQFHLTAKDSSEFSFQFLLKSALQSLRANHV